MNGKPAGTLWCTPYVVEVGDLLKEGENTLEVDVTSTWFNRLVYDAALPENERKTWVIAGPEKDASILPYGLLGPVEVRINN